MEYEVRLCIYFVVKLNIFVLKLVNIAKSLKNSLKDCVFVIVKNTLLQTAFFGDFALWEGKKRRR